MKKILMTLTLALAAAIAIPAAAQSTTTTATEQTKECCKDKKTCDKQGKKECSKESGKACCKDGKAFSKDGKKGKHGKMMKGQGKRKAGDRKEGGKMRQRAENPMMKGITLTADQQEKVKALREKNMAAEKKSKADMKAKSKEEMQKLRADFDKEMEKILDKDQLKQYQANKAEMAAKRAQKKAS